MERKGRCLTWIGFNLTEFFGFDWSQDLLSGWLIYNAHGLDDEGWGPMSSVFLDELLDRLKKRTGLKYCRLWKSRSFAG